MYLKHILVWQTPMYKIVTNGQWIQNYWELNEINIK